MSTVLDDTAQEERKQSAFAESLIDTPLSNQALAENPITFGKRFDADELEILSLYFVDTQANKDFINLVEKGGAGENAQRKFKDTLDKFALYNRAPIEEEPNPYQLPEFIQNKIPFIPKQRKLQRELNAYGFTGRDQYVDPYLPSALGAAVSPAGVLIEKLKNFTNEEAESDIYKSMRFARLFYDRYLSPSEIERMAIKAGGYDPKDVDAQWIDPDQHKLGIVFKTPDTNGYEVWDQPYISPMDLFETIGTEGPALTGEFIARRLALKKGIGKSTFSTGVTKSIFQRMKELGATGVTYGVGGATGEFARLSMGSILDLNDYDLGEIAERSALTGVIATGSVIAGDVVLRILTKIKDLPRGLVPDASFKSLKESFEKAFNTGRRKNNQPPVVLVQNPETLEWYWEEVAQETLDSAKLIDAERISEEITTKDIQTAVNKLLPDINYTIEGKDKILNLGVALPKDQLINDLEHVFLKNAEDPEIRKIYDGMIKGQENLMQQFLYALNDATGATIDKNVSAADLSNELAQIGTNRIEILRAGQEEGLSNILNVLGGLEDDTGKIGTELATLVPDPGSGAGFFERDRLQIKALKEEFLQPSFDNWENALSNPKYADLTTNARYLKTPTRGWENLRNQYQEFQTEDAANAKESLFTILGEDSARKLRRLKGLGNPGEGLVNPNYTMSELNDMRVVLNSFASETNNTSAEIAARKLERGLEQQMQYMINSKASELSGLPLSMAKRGKNAIALAQWKQDNNFGIDLENSWQVLKEDIYRAKVINDTQSLQNNPENFINNLVEKTPKFSKTYTNAKNLVYILDKTGSPLLNELRRSTSAYIQNNVIGGEFSDLNALEKSREFGKWATEHEGLLKAIYPEETFGKINNPKQFRLNVVQKLEEAERKIFEIEQTFGNDSFTNIVTSYLDQSDSFKRGGDYKKQQQKFLELVKDSPLLQNKVSSIAKSWLLNTVMERDAENVPVLNPDKLNNLFTEGFGSTETGETFEKFFAPLIGGAEGKQYVYNLKILNNIGQRQAGMLESTEGLADKEITMPQTGWLERFFIPPLTQTGRRITNFRNITSSRSQRIMAELLLDPKLFNKVMKTRKRDLNIQEFARYLLANNAISAYEVNNKLSSYEDPEKKHGQYTSKFYNNRMDEISDAVDAFNYVTDEIINTVNKEGN